MHDSSRDRRVRSATFSLLVRDGEKPMNAQSSRILEANGNDEIEIKCFT